MKLFTTFIALMIASAVYSQGSDFYSFKVKTLEGQDFDMGSLKGKKVMVVNVASKCGYTPQYKDLEALYERYNGELVIVAFPANNFMNQEPGTAAEIRQFCTENYGVTFPVMEKISVKGKDIHPLYQWLTSKDKNGVMDAEVSWNFQKFLIDEKGKLVDVLKPKEKPDSEVVIKWLAAR
ncbi:MAG: glutathione peroxidase [Bacteroidales bacterium]|jgi:glutathione peroxidase|nr:glutathione peroxidase [Bacteroidales bacterium]MCU0407564.1 glutathione peroxidase [Bacteroidales bacterium]